MSSTHSTYRKYFNDPQDLVAKLQDLVENRESYSGSELFLQMFERVFKLVGDETYSADLKMLNHALLELRYAFKVFAPYRSVRKVSVFGSARTGKDRPEYTMAEQFSNKVTDRGYMVITGAGPGIMEAAQGGAGRARSFGVNIRLPFESKANEVIENDPKLIHFKYFFTRKVCFLKETDAIVIFPGGFGTHDEAFESLTLVQTGKSDLVPIVFVDRPGGTYWSAWLDYVRTHLRDEGYIDGFDESLFHVTESVEDAVDVVDGFYRNYHSTRYLRPLQVIRLNQPVTDSLLERLNREFSDIIVSGKIERLPAALEAEKDEPQTADLHRIAFRFDRKSYGRLRALIDVLNLEPESPLA
ncbi:MAG: TIGR00730 family Rossman fold protein [Planctomycetota bacterium]|nr:TIGR00730 family Rossman fold protein [Planctomycetota bacterium]